MIALGLELLQIINLEELLKPAEIKMVEAVIEENSEVIAEHWNKFFNNNK